MSNIFFLILSFVLVIIFAIGVLLYDESRLKKIENFIIKKMMVNKKYSILINDHLRFIRFKMVMLGLLSIAFFLVFLKN